MISKSKDIAWGATAEMLAGGARDVSNDSIARVKALYYIMQSMEVRVFNKHTHSLKQASQLPPSLMWFGGHCQLRFMTSSLLILG